MYYFNRDGELNHLIPLRLLGFRTSDKPREPLTGSKRWLPHLPQFNPLPILISQAHYMALSQPVLIRDVLRQPGDILLRRAMNILLLHLHMLEVEAHKVIATSAPAGLLVAHHVKSPMRTSARHRWQTTSLKRHGSNLTYSQLRSLISNSIYPNLSLQLFSWHPPHSRSSLIIFIICVLVKRTIPHIDIHGLWFSDSFLYHLIIGIHIFIQPVSLLHKLSGLLSSC